MSIAFAFGRLAARHTRFVTPAVNPRLRSCPFSSSALRSNDADDSFSAEGDSSFDKMRSMFEKVAEEREDLGQRTASAQHTRE